MKYINGLLSVRRAGAVLTGGRITLRSRGLRTGHFNYSSDFVVRCVVDETAIVIRAPGAAPSTAAPAVSKYVSFLFVSWQSERWTVVEEASG